MLLSGLIPRKLVAYYRSFKYRDSFRAKINMLKNDPGKYVILFGTPIHSNMGDHLIADAEIRYLQDVLHLDVMDIPTEMYQIYRKSLIRIVPRNLYIFITGGGWMGDVWPIEEKVLENMVTDFKNNITLIFPQTVFYRNPSKANNVSRRAKRKFAECKRLVICVRDESSFNYVRKQYDNCSLLCPDIALYYPRLKYHSNSKAKIGICFRKDREASSHIITEKIIQNLNQSEFEIIELSTISDKSVSCELRSVEIEALLKKFQSCDLVFTDRLHGMIFSYLSRTSCIAFDNLTKKVSGVYNLWLRDCKYVKVIDSNIENQDVFSLMANMLDIVPSSDGQHIQFDMIDEVLKTWQKSNV